MPDTSDNALRKRLRKEQNPIINLYSNRQMANATVSRLGLVNNSGTNFDELFLKVFSVARC